MISPREPEDRVCGYLIRGAVYLRRDSRRARAIRSSADNRRRRFVRELSVLSAMTGIRWRLQKLRGECVEDVRYAVRFSINFTISGTSAVGTAMTV